MPIMYRTSTNNERDEVSLRPAQVPCSTAVLRSQVVPLRCLLSSDATKIEKVDEIDKRLVNFLSSMVKYQSYSVKNGG